MTTDYVVQVELDHRGVSNNDVDHIHEHLTDWAVSAAENLAGYLELTLTVPANNLRQAVTTGITLAAELELGEPTAVHAATEAISDQRDGVAPLPPLVSVPEAADILGYTRQNVLHLIETGKLPATKVARDYIIVKAALGPLKRDQDN